MEGRVCLLADGGAPAARALAVMLAKMDATVVVVAPTADAAREVRARILVEAGGGRVEALVGDPATREGALELATDVACAHDRVDVLVNNAWIRMRERALTVDGVEATFAVNQLGPWLLTRALLALLKPTEPMRVVNVLGARPAARLDRSNLNGDHAFDSVGAEEAAALARVATGLELARRTRGTAVTVNTVRAGAGWWASTRRKAQGPLFLATSPMLEGVTGGYFVGLREARPPACTADRALARELWDHCEGVRGLREGVRGFWAQGPALAESL